METGNETGSVLDTSSPDFQQQFTDVDFNAPDDTASVDDSPKESFNPFESTEDVEENVETPKEIKDYDFGAEDVDTENDPQENDTVSADSDNEYINAYSSWAKKQGYEVDLKELDAENFGEDDMERLVGKHYVQKYLGNVDPRIVDMAENGVDIDQYMNHRSQLQQAASMDPTLLYKGSMYDFLKNQEAQLGSIIVDELGNPTKPEYVEFLQQEVERRTANMEPEFMTEQGKKIQQQYLNQMDQLPNHLIEQQNQNYKQSIDSYNQEVESLINSYKQKLSKADSLVTNFSGQAEKDSYVDYMKDQLAFKEIDGQSVVPLLHRLENDADFLANTVRLLHMYENGYFTDLKNGQRKKAFEELSVSPVLRKSKGSGSNRKGSGRVVDTTNPKFYEQYK